MVQYPTVNDNADLEFFSTPQCKVRILITSKASNIVLSSLKGGDLRSKYYRDLTG